MAGEIREWFEGFVHRGRPPWSDQPSGSHVDIGRYVEDGRGGREVLASRTLTPEQAAAAGWPLERVVAGLNARALVERDAALADAAAARRERDAVAAARDAAERARLAAEDGRAAAAAERDALAAQLAGREAPSALAAVSDRQFFQALAQAGAIDPAEALAAVMTGVLPGRIEAAVAALPQAEQFAARMLLSGATAFERGHPIAARLGAALGYDAAALDALWREAGTL